MASVETEKSAIEAERLGLLEQIEDTVETPLLILGAIWTGLLIVELIWGLSRPLELVSTIIWVIFLLDFALKFTLAPHKIRYLQSNWISALALALPALRILRIGRVARLLRAARAARGLRLVRVLSSLNRGIRALGATMSRRGFGYMLALTVVVTLIGAAGMYAFEQETGSEGFRDPISSLWWTAMLMTTLGSEYWPKTGEGRVLAFILSIFAFTIFGYVTATLATFFIGRDAQNPEAELASTESIDELRAEIRALREELAASRGAVASITRPNVNDPSA